MSWINWAAFLEDTSELPPDVTFQVSGKTFSAHKFLMAAASPTLRTQFYGSFATPAEQEPIIVEDTTPEAFQSLLDFVYSKHGSKFTWSGLSFRQLFDLLKLADYYLILPLKDLLKGEIAIRSKKLTMDTVFEAAEVADDFKLFDISKDIIIDCREFMIRNTSVQDLMELVNSKNIDPHVFYSLFKYDGEMCPHCTMPITECLHEKVVTEANLKIGLKVYPRCYSSKMRTGFGIITGKSHEKDKFMCKWGDQEKRLIMSYYIYKCKF